jgi:hypothetical protein
MSNDKIPPHVPAKLSGETRKCIGTPKHKCRVVIQLKVGSPNQLRCVACNCRNNAEHSERERRKVGKKEACIKKSYESLDRKQINAYYNYIENEEDEYPDRLLGYRHSTKKKPNAE